MKTGPATSRVKAWILGALLLGAGVLFFFGQAETWLQSAGLNVLTRENHAYLNEARSRALRIFGILTAIKVPLAVVEGSEVGVGFGVQLGDVVQAAYDYVNIAWQTVLAGGVFLLGTLFLLQAVDIVDGWVAGAAFCLFALGFALQIPTPFWERVSRILRDVAVFLAFVAVTLYFLLPLSILGGAYLSSRITSPAIQEAADGLADFKQEVAPDSEDKDTDILSRLSRSTEAVRRMGDFLKEKTAVAAQWVLQLIAGYLFDCVVFPLSLFIVLTWSARRAGTYLIHASDRRGFVRDLGEHLSRRLVLPGSPEK